MNARFAVIATVLTLSFAGANASAAFDYSVTIVPTGQLQANTRVDFTPRSAILLATTSQSITLTDIAVNTTPNATSNGVDTYNIGYTETVSIRNPSGSGPTGSFTIMGTLTGTAGLSGGTPFSFLRNTITSVSGPITLSGVTFSLSDLSYVPATINTTGGAFGASVLTSTAVPEPASALMVGLGLMGLAVAARRRSSR